MTELEKPLSYIVLENVGVKYQRSRRLLNANTGLKSNDFWALKNVSFDVKKGEVLGVIGRNGAGKSTLLSLLAGIIAPSAGSITLNTKNVSLLSLSAGFVPFLTGRKNVVLTGMILGVAKDDILNRMNDIIEFADIGDFIDEPVGTYSTGMKARLGFSIAMSLESDVILIDEVLGVGDSNFKKKSSNALKSKMKNNGTAVIVSHSESTIKELCHRTAVINQGETVFLGETLDALKFYQDLVGKKELKSK